MKKFDTLKSILLVDDDEASNFLHSLFINKLDLALEVNAAINGQEALDFILNKGQGSIALPCMIMLDLRMPVMDGWEFLKMYEEQVPEELKKQIKVVLVTISDNEEDKKRASANDSIVDFAQKPLSDMTFRKILNKHVAFPVEV